MRQAQRLNRTVSSLIANYFLPPRPPYPPLPFDLNFAGAPAVTGGWSGWVQAIPPHNWVSRLSATFTVPSGFRLPASGVPRLSLWVGVFQDNYPLDQSGPCFDIGSPVAGARPAWPMQPWLTDWMGGFTQPQTEALMGPSAVVQSGRPPAGDGHVPPRARMAGVGGLRDDVAYHPVAGPTPPRPGARPAVCATVGAAPLARGDCGSAGLWDAGFRIAGVAGRVLGDSHPLAGGVGGLVARRALGRAAYSEDD
jgi:hypothetical protein